MADRVRIRFGVFDFAPATRELRKDGVPVHLQAQPAHLLALLLADANDVVTFETLRDNFWRAENQTDFDRDLDSWVAEVRSALGDSADSPHFVRTIPRTGYQFIAPLGAVPLKAPAHVHAAKSRVPAVLVMVVAAGLIFALLRRNRTEIPAVHVPVRVAVARFDNQTNNPDFDNFADGLTEAVVAELTTAGSGHFDVIGKAAILRRPRKQRDLVAIASTLKVGYVILGQVQQNPDGIHVLAHLIRLPAQTHLSVVRLDSVLMDTLRIQTELAQKAVEAFSPKLVPLRLARVRD